MKKLVTALFLCCALALAQSHPAVAIRNAKIVTVSGPVINKGTVVVRNGLIEAVGENVAVPADAMLVEGEGLTVYPGLIDALSTWGQPGAAPAAAANRADAADAGRYRNPHRQPRTGRQPAAASRARPRRSSPDHQLGQDRRRDLSATDRRIETGAQRRLHHRRHLPHPRNLRRTGRGHRPDHRREGRRDGRQLARAASTFRSPPADAAAAGAAFRAR